VPVAVGFRVDPKRVTYAVVSGPAADGKFTIVRVGEVRVPYALYAPRQLRFIRTTLLDIIEETGSTRAGLRTIESLAKRKHPFRLNLEGVVQELLASSDVERFIAGPIATIASQLGEDDRTVVKDYIDGTRPQLVKAGWDDLDELQREAVLVALCAGLGNPNHGITGGAR